jgi:hypothetical protein
LGCIRLFYGLCPADRICCYPCRTPFLHDLIIKCRILHMRPAWLEDEMKAVRELQLFGAGCFLFRHIN